ncbi:MAG: PstS family phosphate ABC transporter substrate-binding protein [Planctomycetota bacterium]|nr:PstS family phosphate ABC transporter substrate-binding protein [Planctomycetota bacterium]
MKLYTALTLAVLATLTSCGGNVNGGNRTVIQNKGSDTLVNVAQTWAEEYRKIHPDCAVAVSGGGSGTGIAAMINGTVDIANSSRVMKERELKMARDNGNNPVPFIVGYDALAVFVHKDNPIESITIEQLAAIYGEGGEITRWSQLGITVPGASGDEMVRVSRQNNSGTYAYFREAVLGREGNYKLGSLDMHGSKDVVELVMNTPSAIGYSGLAYATEHVKVVPVSIEGGAPVVPTVDSAGNGSYPIARPLFMYTVGEPEGAVKDYMDWILSDVGQQILLKKGYAPVGKL